MNDGGEILIKIALAPFYLLWLVLRGIFRFIRDSFRDARKRLVRIGGTIVVVFCLLLLAYAFAK